MKSLRDQIDQKLNRLNKADALKSAVIEKKGPLIVTSNLTSRFEGNIRPKTLDSSRRINDKARAGPRRIGRSEKQVESLRNEGRDKVHTEDSDLLMKNIWEHDTLELSKKEAEEIGNQLVDKILAQYGSHMSKRVDAESFHRMRSYMNHRMNYNSCPQQADNPELSQKEEPNEQQFFSSDGFLDQDEDCFPKQYAPVAHSKRDTGIEHLARSVKVRDELQKVIRPQLALSGRKSLRQSEKTSSNQSTLRDEHKMMDLVIKNKVINLYQSNGRTSFKQSASAQNSSFRQENSSVKKQLSEVDSQASRLSECQERSVMQLDGKKVPVYTCKVG